MKIDIICPTRKRPMNMLRMFLSAYETARYKSDLSVWFYIDDDDQESLVGLAKLNKKFPNKAQAIIGPRIVLSDTLNKVWEKIESPEYLMLAGDDIIFRTLDWDTHFIDKINTFSDKIAWAYGRDGYQGPDFGTHGMIHQNWAKAVGYVTPQYFEGDYSDTWLNDIATMINRKFFINEVYIEHMHYVVNKGPIDQTMQEKVNRGNAQKSGLLYNSREMLQKRHDDAQKLRGAMQ